MVFRSRKVAVIVSITRGYAMRSIVPKWNTVQSAFGLLSPSHYSVCQCGVGKSLRDVEKIAMRELAKVK